MSVNPPGIRQIIAADIDRVRTSCGSGLSIDGLPAALASPRASA